MIHHADPIVVGLISLCYCIFAFQLWSQAEVGAFKTKGGRAIFLLVAVFVFCAFAGYLTSLLPASWWVFREALHWALALCSVWLVCTNQAAAVAKMLANERDH